MVLTYTVVAGDGWLLQVAFEVDFDLRVRGIRTRLETPALDCILCRGCEQRMAGFDLGVGDFAVGLNGYEENDGSAYVHAAGKLGIAGRDTTDDGSMNIAGKSGSGAEEETSYDEKGTGCAG
jgi:hypothetical protein